jgi:hypothetical protein
LNEGQHAEFIIGGCKGFHPAGVRLV